MVKDKKRPGKLTSNPDTAAEAPADFVHVAQYIRRRHAADLKIDPMSSPLRHATITGKIKEGLIEHQKQGRYIFIDWNKYGEFPFVRFNKS